MAQIQRVHFTSVSAMSDGGTSCPLCPSWPGPRWSMKRSPLAAGRMRGEGALNLVVCEKFPYPARNSLWWVGGGGEPLREGLHVPHVGSLRHSERSCHRHTTAADPPVTFKIDSRADPWSQWRLGKTISFPESPLSHKWWTPQRAATFDHCLT